MSGSEQEMLSFQAYFEMSSSNCVHSLPLCMCQQCFVSIMPLANVSHTQSARQSGFSGYCFHLDIGNTDVLLLCLLEVSESQINESWKNLSAPTPNACPCTWSCGMSWKYPCSEWEPQRPHLLQKHSYSMQKSNAIQLTDRGEESGL